MVTIFLELVPGRRYAAVVVGVEYFLEGWKLPDVRLLLAHRGASQMGSKELRQSCLCLRYEFFGEKMGECWILLRLLHMGHWEEDQLVLVQLHLGSSGFKIFFEGCWAVVIENTVSFEVGVDIVNTEIDTNVELQPPGIFVNIPVLGSDSKELIPTPPVKNAKNSIFVRLVPTGWVDLCFWLQIWSFVSQGVVGPIIAVQKEMLLDELQKLFIFCLEVWIRFVLFVWKRQGLAVPVWFFGVLAWGLLRFSVHL